MQLKRGNPPSEAARFFCCREGEAMSKDGRRTVIIGAGFSGSLLAVHLLRRSRPADRVFLIERNAAFGRGLAYATGNPHHLLNVRAGNMSAFSDRPDHFLDWVQHLPVSERAGVETTVDRLTFVSRRLYGSYIQHILAREIQGADGVGRLCLVADEAIALHGAEDHDRVEVGCGQHYEADAVVFAVGNFPPQGDTRGYFANPWDPASIAGLDPEAPVLLIGTGLTMIDVVISLLDQGHRGPIQAISRRGQLPRTHAAVAPGSRFLPAATAPGRVLALLMQIRDEVGRAAAEGRDWRCVIDALRPDTQDLWRALPLAEKQRFLRHVRPWWDVHRHRMAPSVAARIAAARAGGQLTILRARLGHLAHWHGGVEAELLPVGGGAPIARTLERVINCSGPLNDIAHMPALLIRGLLAEGRLRPDPLGLGLDVTGEGAALDKAGRISRRLFALGPITKGVFWESTAVPDIRLQCERLAAHIVDVAQHAPGMAALAPS
jgi:uncharacterized NAD(P)/FAD-binding protein YdhS